MALLNILEYDIAQEALKMCLDVSHQRKLSVIDKELKKAAPAVDCVLRPCSVTGHEEIPVDVKLSLG